MLEECVRVHISDSTCAGLFDPASSFSVTFAKADALDLQKKKDTLKCKHLIIWKEALVLAVFYLKTYLKKTDNWQCFHVLKKPQTGKKIKAEIISIREQVLVENKHCQSKQLLKILEIPV